MPDLALCSEGNETDGERGAEDLGIIDKLKASNSLDPDGTYLNILKEFIWEIVYSILGISDVQITKNMHY